MARRRLWCCSTIELCGGQLSGSGARRRSLSALVHLGYCLYLIAGNGERGGTVDWHQRFLVELRDDSIKAVVHYLHFRSGLIH